MNPFVAAFSRTMEKEGEYVLEPGPGGETFMGISRPYWPSWPGWHIIDRYKAENRTDGYRRSGILGLVKTFYLENFWNRIQGDKLSELSLKISYEVFDTAVNMGVMQSTKFLQTGLNMQREYTTAYPELVVDGLLGAATLRALDLYLASSTGFMENNENILLKVLNGEQYIHYKNNPRHSRNRGWFLRT